MKIPVLVAPISGNRFQARLGEPFSLTGEGGTRKEAMRALKEQFDKLLQSGAEVRFLEFPDENPWLAFAGTIRNDELFDEWQQAIAENRRAIDADPDAF